MPRPDRRRPPADARGDGPTRRRRASRWTSRVVVGRRRGERAQTGRPSRPPVRRLHRRRRTSIRGPTVPRRRPAGSRRRCSPRETAQESAASRAAQETACSRCSDAPSCRAAGSQRRRPGRAQRIEIVEPARHFGDGIGDAAFARDRQHAMQASSRTDCWCRKSAGAAASRRRIAARARASPRSSRRSVAVPGGQQACRRSRGARGRVGRVEALRHRGRGRSAAKSSGSNPSGMTLCGRRAAAGMRSTIPSIVPCETATMASAALTALGSSHVPSRREARLFQSGVPSGPPPTDSSPRADPRDPGSRARTARGTRTSARRRAARDRPDTR